MEELKELKARAYDLIAILERAKKELDAVNVRIFELSKGDKNHEHDTKLHAVSNS